MEGMFDVSNKMKDKLKVNYIKSLEDPNFKKIVNSLDVSEEEKINNTSKIQDCLCELKNCKNCKGLMFCKNANAGYVYYPEVYNDQIEFTYIACKYKKEAINVEKNKLTREKELEKITMKDIDTTDKKRFRLIKWITNFINNYDPLKRNKGLYLHGNFGCGKTYIITACFNELKKKGINSEIVHFSTLLRDLKANFDELDTTISYLENVDLLLIDDIGAEKVSEWSRDEILGTILQTRMNNYKTTFFTSNHSIEELENYFAKDGNQVASARVIERIKVLTEDMEIEAENRRN